MEVEENERLHVAVALLMLLVVVYLLMSVSITVVRGFWAVLLRPANIGALVARVRFSLLSLMCLGLGWPHVSGESLSASLFNVVRFAVNSSQPVLLRIFGVGGQGFLHLGSLYFVNVTKLTLPEVTWRVAAGGYTTILTAVFMGPLLMLFGAYVIPLLEAINKASSKARTRKEGTSATDVSENGARSSGGEDCHGADDDDDDEWECEICLHVNNATHVTCRACESHRWEFSDPPGELRSVDSVDSTAGLTIDSRSAKSDGGGGDPIHGELLDCFDMEAFEVLAQLGTGTTGDVSLGRVVDRGRFAASSPSRRKLAARRRRPERPEGSPFPIQEHSSFDGDSPSDLDLNAGTDGLFTSSTQIPPTRLDSEDDGYFLSEGESFSDSNSLQHPRIDVVQPRAPPVAAAAETHAGRSMHKSTSVSESLGVRSFGPSGSIMARESPLGNLLAKSFHAGGTTRVCVEDTTSAREQVAPGSGARHFEPGGGGLTQGLKRATRSVPTQLDNLDKDAGNEAAWGEIKWINKEDLMDDDANTTRLPRNFSKLSLGLDNSGVPEDDLGTERSAIFVGDNSADELAGDLSKSKLADKATRVSPELTGQEERAMQKHGQGEAWLSEEEMEEENATASGLRVSLSEMPDLVAIKTMHKRKIVAMGMRRSIEREREVLGRIKSPFLCGMYGAFQDPTWAYLILEPVPAGDLASLLEARIVMHESEAKFYVGCVLLALEHLHDRGIACLDIKPENMLLDQWGYLKVCDFGIARVFSDDLANMQRSPSEAGHATAAAPRWEFTGTPEYMAPEVVRTDPVAPGLPGLTGPDCWAVGVLIFELLSGATPFASEFEDDNAHIVETIKHFSNQCAKRNEAYREASASMLDKLWRRGKPKSLQAQSRDLRNCLEQNLAAEQAALQREWFAELRSKGHQVRDLVVWLLRPDPLQRCPAVGSTKGGDACRKIMKHAWFTRTRTSDWSFDQLRIRGVYPPFVPDATSLAPPFRGENVTLDITQQKPLNFAEFQAARDLVFAESSTASVAVASSNSSDSDSGPDDNVRLDQRPWTGFIEVQRPPVNDERLKSEVRTHAKKLLQARV